MKRPPRLAALIPAGIWLIGARALLQATRAARNLGMITPSHALSLAKRAGALYRAGFGVWRHNGGKWR